MSALRLTARQRNRLEAQLKATHDAGLVRRTLAVLEIARGAPVAEVARLLRTSRVSVYHWVSCYARDHDPDALADHRGGNHPSLWTEDLQAALRECLGQSPDRFGYQAVSWTVDLLRQQLTLSCEGGPSTRTVRRQLNDSGYVWKRPRYVLDPDPERDKKTADSTPDAAVAGTMRQAVRG
jgi:transposase